LIAIVRFSQHGVFNGIFYCFTHLNPYKIRHTYLINTAGKAVSQGSTSFNNGKADFFYKYDVIIVFDKFSLIV